MLFSVFPASHPPTSPASHLPTSPTHHMTARVQHRTRLPRAPPPPTRPTHHKIHSTPAMLPVWLASQQDVLPRVQHTTRLHGAPPPGGQHITNTTAHLLCCQLGWLANKSSSQESNTPPDWPEPQDSFAFSAARPEMGSTAGLSNCTNTNSSSTRTPTSAIINRTPMIQRVHGSVHSGQPGLQASYNASLGRLPAGQHK